MLNESRFAATERLRRGGRWEEASFWEAGLIADIPATIKDDVQSKVADWERRCGVKLPPDALQNLQLRMIHLVDQCIVAALKNPAAFQRGESFSEQPMASLTQ